MQKHTVDRIQHFLKIYLTPGVSCIKKVSESINYSEQLILYLITI